MTPTPTGGPVRFEWHPYLHQHLARERLYFFRVSFSPVYDRNAIIVALQSVMQQSSVTSYEVTELLGIFDVNIRLWLPASSSHSIFENALVAALRPHGLQVLDIFLVTGLMRASNVTLPGIDSADDSLIAAVTTLPTDSTFIRITAGSTSPEDYQYFINRGLMVATQDTGALPFYVVIPAPPGGIIWPSAKDALRERLLSVLNTASNLTDLILYEGEGFAKFLIAGRMSPNRYDALSTEIIDRINSLSIGGFFGTRTYTNIGTQTLPLIFQDILPVAVPVPPAAQTDVRTYLSQPESLTLDFCSAAFVDIPRWLLATAPTESAAPLPSERVTIQGLMRIVVGMLNAQGGHIIIGVLEADKYTTAVAQAKLVSFPRYENRICIGTGFDMQGHDWDWYVLKLQTYIDSRIEPSPRAVIAISGMQYEDVTLCLLTIQRTTDEWFYLIDDVRGPRQFYAREDSRTLELSGMASDRYKQHAIRTVIEPET